MEIRLLEFEEKYSAITLIQEVFWASENLGYTEFSAQSFLQLLASHGSSLAYLGAFENNILVGVLGFHIEHHHIVYLFVRLKKQKKTIGTQLFQKYLEIIQTENPDSVRVNAPLGTICFFEKIGFDRIGVSQEAIGMQYQAMEYRYIYRKLGQLVRVIVDHPYGSIHPYYPDEECTCNYGYLCPEGRLDEELKNAYVIGPQEPVEYFDGIIVAIIFHRYDHETRFIVAKQKEIDHQKIIDAIAFQEQNFEVFIKWLK